MDHYSTLVLLIKEHREKYNEAKRIYRRLRKAEQESEWRRAMVGYNAFHAMRSTSDPKYLTTGPYDRPRDRVPVEAVFQNKKQIAEYRKWCRLAASWRRAKWEAHELLCAMRAVGKVYGTKIQTRSNDGNSFNRPFFITIDGRKIPIKRFLDDQAFEEIILKEK